MAGHGRLVSTSEPHGKQGIAEAAPSPWRVAPEDEAGQRNHSISYCL